MVGGGRKKDDLPSGISNQNVFAALETLRKKKKSDGSKNKTVKKEIKEPEPQVFWTPAPLNAKSWADVDDDDDDDYFATTAPPRPVWNSSEQQDKGAAAAEEESESEDDGLDLGDDEVDEEPDHEPETQHEPIEAAKKPPLPPVSREAERQLSKKELKKKELAELDAVLAELGISNDAAAQPDAPVPPVLEEKKTEVTVESKASKKKKKKDKDKEKEKPSEKASDVKENTGEVPLAGVEKLKKLAPAKKKKSGKEMDSAARAAAVEAAARTAKLAAAKKKEKNHYNQQPVR